METYKKNMRKLFQRRSTDVCNEDYEQMHSRDLNVLSLKEIKGIVIRYDHEVHYLNKQLEKLNREAACLKTTVLEKEDQIIVLKTTNDLLSKELCQKLKIKRDEKISNLVNEKIYAEGKYHNLKEDLNVMISEKESIKELNSKLSFQNDSMRFELNSLKQTLSYKNTELNEKETKLHSKIAKLMILKDQLAEYKKEIFDLKQTYNLKLSENTKDHLDEKNSILKDALYSKEQLIFNQKLYEKEIQILNEKIDNIAKENEILVLKTKKHKNSLHFIKNIKFEVQKIYNNFLREIRRNNDGDSSFYSIQSSQYTNIERDLNKLIFIIDDDINKKANPEIEEFESS